jgi:hypothetical protein
MKRKDSYLARCIAAGAWGGLADAHGGAVFAGGGICRFHAIP